eukprot:m.423394 g.423394  ORF g.423394 m.423394 type:complete len:63 (+) comp16855_c0_seq7:2129-2317(+)
MDEAEVEMELEAGGDELAEGSRQLEEAELIDRQAAQRTSTNRTPILTSNDWPQDDRAWRTPR